MSRNWSKGLAAVAVAGVGLLLAIPPAPAEPPSELIKKANVTWQTRSDLKPFADAVDKQIGNTAVVPEGDPPVATGTEKARGFAIHMACEEVDMAHYKGYRPIPKLPATISDREAMRDIAKDEHYKEVAVLAAKPSVPGELKATRALFLKAISDLASLPENEKPSGANQDIILITYSGHGAQIRYTDSDGRVESTQEALCLNDGMLTNDEIHAALSIFPKGIRIIAVIDACHSESSVRDIQLSAADYGQAVEKLTKDPKITREALVAAIPKLDQKLTTASAKATISSKTRALVQGVVKDVDDKKVVVRALPNDAVVSTYAANKEDYDKRRNNIKNVRTVQEGVQALDAALITMAACLNAETALDNGSHGLYTQELLDLLRTNSKDIYTNFENLLENRVRTQALTYKVEGESSGHQQNPMLTRHGKTPEFSGKRIFAIHK